MYIYNTKINIRISLTLRFVMFVCVGLMDVMCLMMMWHMCVIDDVTHVIDDVTYVSDDDVTHCWSLYAQVWWMWWCGLTSRWRRRRRRSSLRSGFFFFINHFFVNSAGTSWKQLHVLSLENTFYMLPLENTFYRVDLFWFFIAGEGGGDPLCVLVCVCVCVYIHTYMYVCLSVFVLCLSCDTHTHTHTHTQGVRQGEHRQDWRGRAASHLRHSGRCAHTGLIHTHTHTHTYIHTYTHMHTYIHPELGHIFVTLGDALTQVP